MEKEENGKEEKGKEEFRYPKGHNWEGLTPNEVNVAYAKTTKVKSEKVKESKLTNKLRKNPYIVLTFALGLFAIILIVGSITENKTIIQTENEKLCSVVYDTPAWISPDGKVMEYGVLIPPNQSIDLVNQVLIPGGIKLLYIPNHPACQTQIDYIKSQGTWEDYKNVGLAVDCGELQ